LARRVVSKEDKLLLKKEDKKKARKRTRGPYRKSSSPSAGRN
jgi:hypothetical protein